MKGSKLTIISIIGFFVLIFLAYQFDSCGENEQERLVTERREKEKEAKRKEDERKKLEQEETRLAKEQEEKRRKDDSEKFYRKVHLANQIEAMLESEWDASPSVNSNGKIELSRHTNNGNNYLTYRFHITGVNITSNNGSVRITGAIKESDTQAGDGFSDITSVIISRNSTLADSLEVFKILFK